MEISTQDIASYVQSLRQDYLIRRSSESPPNPDLRIAASNIQAIEAMLQHFQTSSQKQEVKF